MTFSTKKCYRLSFISLVLVSTLTIFCLWPTGQERSPLLMVLISWRLYWGLVFIINKGDYYGIEQI